MNLKNLKKDENNKLKKVVKKKNGSKLNKDDIYMDSIEDLMSMRYGLNGPAFEYPTSRWDF